MFQAWTVVSTSYCQWEGLPSSTALSIRDIVNLRYNEGMLSSRNRKERRHCAKQTLERRYRRLWWLSHPSRHFSVSMFFFPSRNVRAKANLIIQTQADTSSENSEADS